MPGNPRDIPILKRSEEGDVIIWSDLTNHEIEDLDRALPAIVPVGLVEAHGPHLTVGYDVYAAEYVARRLCEATGAILCPAIPYGFADTNRGYPGTLGVRTETLAAIVADLCDMFCFHGFKKVIFLNGHGANHIGVRLGFQRAWEKWPDLKPTCRTYWTVAGIDLHHADEGETSIALAMGATVHGDRMRDAHVQRPWYEVRSRFQIAPESGSVNGSPSKASVAMGNQLLDQIMSVLVDKVKTAIADK